MSTNIEQIAANNPLRRSRQLSENIIHTAHICDGEIDFVRTASHRLSLQPVCCDEPGSVPSSLTPILCWAAYRSLSMRPISYHDIISRHRGRSCRPQRRQCFCYSFWFSLLSRVAVFCRLVATPVSAALTSTGLTSSIESSGRPLLHTILFSVPSSIAPALLCEAFQRLH